MTLHRVRIEQPRAERIFTRVTLDGQPLLGVTRVQFDSGDADHPFGRVTITLDAETEIVTEAGEVVWPRSEAPTLAVWPFEGGERRSVTE